MRSFQTAGCQPVRPENPTNNLENICGLDNTDDEDNADGLGESGGNPRQMKLRLISSLTDHSDRGAVIVLWLRQGVTTTEDRITMKCQ